ncbi:MAG: DUF3179 domain-containing protein [Myxococcales bacterium]|nr:DUF3179 domain-containing protein [Myxococcales bacterium]
MWWMMATLASAGTTEDLMAFVEGSVAERNRATARLTRRGSAAEVPALLEIARFSSAEQRVRLMKLAQRLSGERFGGDRETAFQWVWSQSYTPSDDYARFKSQLYRRIDPAFATYFDEPASTALVRLDEIRWGGVLKDGIPPLDHPPTIPADKASYLGDDDVVFGLVVNGEARAYPKRILAWHELVRDQVGGTEIAGVYCTLCGAMIAYDPAGHTLGTSGFLYRSNKLMYDQATSSLWNTLVGEPVVGPLVGKGIQLQVFPVVTSTWGTWRSAHPTTTVLSLDTGHHRDYGEGVAYAEYFSTDELMFTVPGRDTEGLPNKQEVLVLRFAEAPTAVLSTGLPSLYSGTAGPVHYTILTDASRAHRVYETSGLTGLVARPDGLDSDQGTWIAHPHGLVREDGAVKPRLPTHRAFWFAWRSQHPDTVLLRP